METGLFSGSSAPCPRASIVTSLPPHAPAPSSVHTFSCQDPLPWRLRETLLGERLQRRSQPQPNSRAVFAAGRLECVGWVQTPLLRSPSAVLPSFGACSAPRGFQSGLRRTWVPILPCAPTLPLHLGSRSALPPRGGSGGQGLRACSSVFPHPLTPQHTGTHTQGHRCTRACTTRASAHTCTHTRT